MPVMIPRWVALLDPLRRYLLLDTFSGSFPAGSVNGTMADIGGARTVVDTYANTELIANGGFETAGANPPLFASWSQNATDGAIADESSLVHAGSHAAKLTAGAGGGTRVYQYCTLIPGFTYQLSFWTRGDGTNQGQYGIWDSSHSNFIIAPTNTGVPGATYAQVTVTFTAPSGCISAGPVLYAPGVNGGVAYFDTVSCLPTSGLLSIANGVINVAGGLASPSFGVPRCTWNSLTRVANQLLLVRFTPTSGNFVLGLANGNGANPTASGIRLSGTSLYAVMNQAVNTATASLVQIGSVSAGTPYEMAIDLRPTAGTALWLKGGALTNYTLLMMGTGFNANPITPGFWNYDGVLTIG